MYTLHYTLARGLEGLELLLTSHKFGTILKKKNKKRIKVDLHIRKAWFINSLLVNMEAWYNLLKSDIEVKKPQSYLVVRTPVRNSQKS